MRVIFLRSGLVILGDNLVATRAAKNCWNYRGAKWDEGNIDYTTVIYLWLYIQVVYTIHIPCWFFSLKSQSWTSPVMLCDSCEVIIFAILHTDPRCARPFSTTSSCGREMFEWNSRLDLLKASGRKVTQVDRYRLPNCGLELSWSVPDSISSDTFLDSSLHLPETSERLQLEILAEMSGSQVLPMELGITKFLGFSPSHPRRGCVWVAGLQKALKVKLVKLGIWTRVSTAPPPLYQQGTFLHQVGSLWRSEGALGFGSTTHKAGAAREISWLYQAGTPPRRYPLPKWCSLRNIFLLRLI